MRKFSAIIVCLIAISCLQLPVHAKAQHRTLLVTGCARSGTGYISLLMREAGLDIGHEYIGKQGLSSWPMAVDDDKAPWGPPPNSLSFKHIFHQVRNPLQVISSVLTTEPKSSWEYIIKHIPEIHWSDSHLVKAAKYWYYWNQKAAEKAEWTYRLEDIGSIWDEFESRLGVTLDKDALSRVPRNANHRGRHVREITWDILKNEIPQELYDKIQALAASYGYI